MVSSHGCHSGLAAAELGGSHWSAGLGRLLPTPRPSPAPGFPWRPKPIKDTGLGASSPLLAPGGDASGGPALDPPTTFPCSMPGLNPLPTLGLSSQGPG